MPITSEQLKKVVPKCRDIPGWTAALNTAMDRFEINTPQRIAAFVAQLAHESGEFERLKESLSYSSAERLTKVWPNRFPTVAQAEPFVRNEQKLGNKVYANRLGNGDEASGDGFRYRGRGLIQLTGRANYRDTGKAIGVDLEARPDLLLEPATSALAAAQFWSSRGLNALADSNAGDNDDEDFVTITKRINGGTVGLAERKKYWASARAALNGA
jgi:putative chitinase